MDESKSFHKMVNYYYVATGGAPLRTVEIHCSNPMYSLIVQSVPFLTYVFRVKVSSKISPAFSPPMLTASSSADEAAAWLRERLPEGYGCSTAAAALKAGLDGAKLLSLTEDEMGSTLGFTKFGRKRKLSIMLKEAADAASRTAPSASVTAAVSSSEPAVIAPLETDELDPEACERQLQVLTLT